ncbi:P-loop containing nucleoside triphosphate hydrolase protein [Microdochium trichocladiopsis]|uniref:P-loop containing nucleoside triphosphate hydrolase protein n=1 Tax=Microdochium trichocladiopsis TaxID=1682393 RepID=A0A9P8XQQ1_9PEZI|nr:P-loop containing nucleoside triphosphate hydrolase protein [Microdochium trichocladiopsis]KAH7012056.1 P-loop containing nucleoside triphosphate hydrolase protein [Microdochium trichocladiopsis]
MSRRTPNTWKVVFCGDGGVGKSTLIYQYRHEMFLDDYDPTQLDVHLPERKRYPATIIDTSGVIAHPDAPGHIRTADVIVLVFDVTQLPTLMNVRSFAGEPSDKAKYVLVGNKCDKLEGMAIVEAQRARTVAQVKAELKCQYFEVSAEKKSEVSEIFDHVLQLRDAAPSPGIASSLLSWRYLARFVCTWSHSNEPGSVREGWTLYFPTFGRRHVCQHQFRINARVTINVSQTGIWMVGGAAVAFG